MRQQGTHLHFVGIGGIGMSGIAEVFLNQGYRVSGSDLAESETTRRLKELGAKIFVGHAPGNIEGARVVVVSSAVRATNPEVVAARKLQIPVIPRAEMLGELMRGKTGIAIAGSHGKTTTTSMMATVLTYAKLDPTLVIGGKVDSLGGNAKHGQGQFVVAEADESDGSFLHLPATYAIVTNVDNDHLDHFGTMEALEDAFVGFIAKLPFYGLAIVCGDDPGVRRCLEHFIKPFQTYGLSKACDYYASGIRHEGFGSTFEVFGRERHDQSHKSFGRFTLGVPGEHNVLNAVAVFALCRKLDLDSETIREGLAEFRGVKRRFEIRWRSKKGDSLVVEDYGHHPTEIAATLAAARRLWKGRIVTVFQPHRYSRTLHCHDGFLTAFKESDVLLVSDIYPAGEEPIEGVSAESLAAEIGAQGDGKVEYCGDLTKARERILASLKTGDLVLCVGAGSITRLADDLSRELSGKEPERE
jgi:UDP-N-acetylmuramate--alanine ligase